MILCMPKEYNMMMWYTAGPQLTSFYSTLFHYDIDSREKNWPGLLCGVSTSHLVFVGFLQGHGFPPTSQRCAGDLNWGPNCPGLIECGWDGEWPFNGRYLFRVGPTLHLEPIMSRNWNKQVGKWLFYLFLLIFLKCMWSSHVSQCLILEVFGVFLWKFDISVTRNMPSEHNSCLCQLTCSKTGFVICGFA